MAVACLVISTTQAQTNIRGKIVDALSRQPLEGVSVTDARTMTVKTISDVNGNFILASAGRIIISYIGYRSITVDTEKIRIISLACSRILSA